MSHPSIGTVRDNTSALYDPLKREKTPKPEEIVPEDDLPFSRVMRFGFGMISRKFWKHISLSNPILCYLISKRRTRKLQDIAALFPWLLLSLIEVAVIVIPPINFIDNSLFALFFWHLTLIPLIMGLITIFLTRLEFNWIQRSVSLEELVLTRMDPDEVLFGLSVRCIGLQLLGSLAGSIALATAVFAKVLFVVLFDGATGSPGLMAGLFLAALRLILLSATIHYASAIAVRSNFFIKDTFRSFFKAAAEWFRGWFLIVIATLSLLLFGSFLAYFLWILGCIAFFLIIVFLMGCYDKILDWSQETITYTARNRDFWWMRMDGEQLTGEFPPKGLFALWKRPEYVIRVMTREELERRLNEWKKNRV